MWHRSQTHQPWLRWYQEDVPRTLDIPSVPVTRLLDDAVERDPRHTALVYYGRKIGYAELQRDADRFAAALRRLGVRPGDRVALILPNCPQQVIAFFGILRLGAVVVGHNPRTGRKELARQLSDCDAKVAVVLDHAYDALRSVHRDVPLEHVIVTSAADYLPRLKRLALRLPLRRMRQLRAELMVAVPDDPGLLDFVELLGRSPRHVRQAPVDPARDLAAIQYTGGNEASPKGVMLTHRNLVANACQSRAWYPARREGKEVTLAAVPLFHSFGMTLCLTLPMLMTSSIVLLPRFDPDEVISAMRRYRPTLFPGVPPVYERVLRSPRLRARDLRSLRVCVSSGMTLRNETVQLYERYGRGLLVQAYGLTEATAGVMCNPLDGNARQVSVGVPLPGTDAVVVDEEEPTRILPAGQAGELVIRGPQVFHGYWKQPLETAQVLSKGWLRTGDIAVMSPDGFFTIIEPHGDMIKVSGFSVFPAEVEDVLCRHPMVTDCAVIGLPDPQRGQRVAACVVMHPSYPFSADELRRHCEKHLTHYKVPHEFFQRPDLPRSIIGAPLRQVLRDEYATVGQH